MNLLHIRARSLALLFFRKIFYNPITMRISFYTLGCKANQADNQLIQRTAAQLGWQIVNYGNECDYCVVNICAVTHGAEQRSRQMLRAAKNNAAKVIASGCYIEKIPEIDLYFQTPQEVVDYLKNIFQGESLPQPRARTRAAIRIQDGCNFNCSYCLIHKIRGKSKSRPTDEIINEIKHLETQNYKEVILTGINIMQYADINGLLKRIINETEIPRIRLGSVDPRLVTDDFLNLFLNKRLLPHLHLSLQSGSDRILKLMNRHYTADQYLDLIERARKIDPLFSFTTDIIVGFPKENNEDMRASADIIKKAQFTKVHLFPYSPRPGTAAAKIKEKINPQKIKLSMDYLGQVARDTRKKWLKRYIGKSMTILIEEKTGPAWQGYAPYYFKTHIHSLENLQNKIISTPINLDNIY